MKPILIVNQNCAPFDTWYYNPKMDDYLPLTLGRYGWQSLRPRLPPSIPRCPSCSGQRRRGPCIIYILP